VVGVTAPGWPDAGLDRIARLRVLAAGLPGAAVVEARLDAPFDRVWGWVSDLERSVPSFDAGVRSLRVVRREPAGDGERLRIRSTAAALWLPVTFDVDLAPGWCWMASRPQAYVVGMAAEPDGDGTRYAHLEAVAFAAPRAVRPLLAPLLAASRARHRRHVSRDVAGIRRGVEGDER
jgi:hypothetical protein